ncbi:pyridoxamine 5'-phosphate oxidase family protein [Rhodococcus opacus]|uniref:Pyridoxamine 5'-phosphate oxidase N-terminal domain-containing protein n=1 Tax=Rhodococcus opacus TaxID=37919 RepID=A0A076EZN7_RHOOP|nr:pyridoxamine 5'-phosphate oxidase family protein [Rhodococcus opacus]AII10888.1 hypothetical protein EP51_42850 [Rhodococcus opacus]
MASRRSQIRLEPDEIDTFLAEHWTLVLGTVTKDGWPHMTALSYGIVDGTIVVASFREAQKVVNAQRNSHVTVLIEENQENYFKTRGVLMFGEAEIREDLDSVVLASKAVVAQRRKILGEEVFIPDSVEKSASKRCVIAIKPTKIVSWDHSRLGGKY